MVVFSVHILGFPGTKQRLAAGSSQLLVDRSHSRRFTL